MNPEPVLPADYVAPRPYYDEGGITIYHGDCRQILPGLTADVVVTDPPYGIGVKYGSFEDSPDALDALIADVWPLLGRYKRIALTPGVGNLRRYPPPVWTLCWFDPGGIGSGPWGFCTWQPILVYGQDPYLTAGKGRRPDGLQSMQRGDPDKHVDHPCPKPISVMRWLIQRVAHDPAEVILDPFMGSGSTLRAAKDLGRRAIGIELEERFCEVAARRLAQQVLDLGGAA